MNDIAKEDHLDLPSLSISFNPIVDCLGVL